MRASWGLVVVRVVVIVVVVSGVLVVVGVMVAVVLFHCWGSTLA